MNLIFEPYCVVSAVSSATAEVELQPPQPEDSVLELVTIIDTVFKPDDDLLNPAKPIYQEAVRKVIDDLRDSWNTYLDVPTALRPFRIQVIGFLVHGDAGKTVTTIFDIDIIPDRKRRSDEDLLMGCGEDEVVVTETVTVVRNVSIFNFH